MGCLPEFAQRGGDSGGSMAKRFDRDMIFQWIERNADRIETTIEKSVRTVQSAAKKVNQKIDSNPTTKKVKDKVVEVGGKQFEKIKDVRIGKTRIGDVPNAAQRLTERQVYKLISKLCESNPDFEWKQFLPDPNRFPVFDAFEVLGLPYGTPFEEVKKSYRMQMREWHPDKHANDPEQEKLATQKTQELTVAYETICKH
jgi:DnaJ-domain-containing protein 1